MLLQARKPAAGGRARGSRRPSGPSGAFWPDDTCVLGLYIAVEPFLAVDQVYVVRPREAVTGDRGRL